MKLAHSDKPFESLLFSFGFGDHDRLGLGDDDQRSCPCLVTFPKMFSPIEVSAGEQHSLARGLHSCYSWGNNAMGQLGAGNPNLLEFSTVPVSVLIHPTQ